MRLIFILFSGMIYLTGFSQTQAELNKKANDSYKKTEKDLNEIYQKIMIDYKSDTVFTKNLKESQRIWITFRDAELKMKYPEREPGFYGSVYPMCVSIYLEQLTWDRIKTLKIWIEGVEEGDACNGTVKLKE